MKIVICIIIAIYLLFSCLTLTSMLVDDDYFIPECLKKINKINVYVISIITFILILITLAFIIYSTIFR